MIGPIPFDKTKATPNTLVLVDLRGDIKLFLHTFEALCAGRAKLTWSQQLPALFALLTFGIAKSIMIDAYVYRDNYEDPSPWTANHALKISSAYRALVSVFCSASKSDIVVGIDGDDPARLAREELRELVNFRSWASQGFSSTKSFLLSLGTCFLPDGSFNGFLAQKVGIDTISKMPTKTSDDRTNEDRAIRGGQAHGSTAESGNHSRTLLEIELKSAPTQPMGIYYPELNHLGSRRHMAQQKAVDPNALSTAQSGIYSSIRFVSHGSDEDHMERRGHGGRTGALNVDALERAREIRKLGACWNCWVMKVPVRSELQ
jgi:hypothetical protein